MMGSELLSLLMSWVPFIVLVIVWLLLMRSMRTRWGRSPSGATWFELTEQQLAETRRMNATLERIALALEKRVQG
jgi:ATP-dependent Zn protease